MAEPETLWLTIGVLSKCLLCTSVITVWLISLAVMQRLAPQKVAVLKPLLLLFGITDILLVIAIVVVVVIYCNLPVQ